jgi:hypothetical protein
MRHVTFLQLFLNTSEFRRFANIVVTSLLARVERIGFAVTIETLIREVLGSNFNRHTAYPDKGVSWILSVLPGIPLEDNIFISPLLLISKPFPVHQSSVMLLFNSI